MAEGRVRSPAFAALAGTGAHPAGVLLVDITDGSFTDETDVGVVSISDRRRIKDLEAKTANLERELAEARGKLQPLITHEYGADHCFHTGGFIVLDNLEEIRCKQCGSAINPYIALRKISHREVTFCYTLNGLRKEAAELTAQVKKLKAQRSSIRRRVRDAADTSTPHLLELVRTHDLQAIGIAKVGSQWMAQVLLPGGTRESSLLGSPESALAELVTVLQARTSVKTSG